MCGSRVVSSTEPLNSLQESPKLGRRHSCDPTIRPEAADKQLQLCPMRNEGLWPPLLFVPFAKRRDGLSYAGADIVPLLGIYRGDGSKRKKQRVGRKVGRYC